MAVGSPALADELELPPGYRRANTADLVITPLSTAALLALRFYGRQPQGDWKGGILFDDALSDLMVLETISSRSIAESIADIGVLSVVLYPIADVVVLGTKYGSWSAAGEIFLLDVQAFVASGAIVWGIQYFVGRARPLATLCESGSTYECEAGDADDGRAFISGHVAAAFTAVGLTCLNHSRLDLYGKNIPCIAAASVATVSAIARMHNGAHYFSDVALGAAVGLLTGLVLPMALHHKFSKSEELRTDASYQPIFAVGFEL